LLSWNLGLLGEERATRGPILFHVLAPYDGVGMGLGAEGKKVGARLREFSTTKSAGVLKVM